jgi:cation diffusion facilitator family transporter
MSTEPSLIVIWLGQVYFPELNIHWIDPVAAIFVALLILRAAYELTVKSIRDLMDEQLPSDEENLIRDIIRQEPSIYGFHRLRTRKAGQIRFIDFHIKVNPAMTVHDSHNITKRLERRIGEKFPESAITIHIEPCDGECADMCIAGCRLSASERSEMARRRG